MNIGAVLGQVSVGGDHAHLREQLACLGVPSICQNPVMLFWSTSWACSLEEVAHELAKAGEEERKLAIERTEFDEDVPRVPVVVDAGWSKHTHKHYNYYI